jgi:hypothetical protein
MITADLSKNEKQSIFFDTALAAAFGDNPFRYLFYGGAIRGGKTYACLVTLILLCRIFPGSKWYVIRKSFTNIQETTLPTMYKILGKAANVKWNRDKSNFFCEFKNTGSRIFFAGEEFAKDPKLTWMLGLECNGFFLEQVEELQEHTFEMCISRTGSWLIPDMPTPLILGSFNPTLTWIKRRVYMPWSEDTLQAPYFYMDASANDNPYVTAEQWKNWENLDDELYKQFVGGSWDFAKPANVFAYSFNEKKHHKDIGYNSDMHLYCSFDFNVEPITCLMAQHDIGYAGIFKEYRLLNSDIWALTDHIVAEYPEAFFMITGDATGQSRQAISKGNRNYYQVIKQQLVLSPNQIKVPRANPSVRNTRVLTNSLFSKHGNYWINTNQCPHLTIDLNSVVVDEHGEIEKAKDKRKSHLLDCFSGDTIISCKGGDKPIEAVRIGDEVLTRGGYKKVIDSWDSSADLYEVVFSNGDKVKCTKDHKFFTDKFGWLSICDIFDRNIPLCKIDTRLLLSKGKQSGFTGKYGKIITDQSQKVTMCTTKIMTQTTMQSKISNLLRRQNIAKCTWPSEFLKTLSSFNNLQRLGKSMQKSGMEVRRGFHGIRNMQLISHLGNSIMEKQIAFNAIENTKRNHFTQSFATTTVNQHTDDNSFVTVSSLNYIGKSKVYDITVEDFPEFFANGYLVHNCLRYYNWTFHRDFLDKSLYQYNPND